MKPGSACVLGRIKIQTGEHIRVVFVVRIGRVPVMKLWLLLSDSSATSSL